MEKELTGPELTIAKTVSNPQNKNNKINIETKNNIIGINVTHTKINEYTKNLKNDL